MEESLLDTFQDTRLSLCPAIKGGEKTVFKFSSITMVITELIHKINIIKMAHHKLKDKHECILGVNYVMKCDNIGMLQLL